MKRKEVWLYLLSTYIYYPVDCCFGIKRRSYYPPLLMAIPANRNRILHAAYHTYLIPA